MRKTDVTLAFFGVFFVGFGLVTLARPLMMAQLFGLVPDGTAGLNEIRAAYGGMFLGQGLLYCIACNRSKWLSPAWLFLAVSMGGLAIGRTLSFVVDGDPGWIHLLAFFCESLMAIIGFCRVRKLEASQGKTQDQEPPLVTQAGY